MLPCLQEKLLSRQCVTIAPTLGPKPGPTKAQQRELVEPVSCMNTSTPAAASTPGPEGTTPAAASLGGRNALSFNQTHCHPGLGQNFFLQGPWSHWVRTHPSDFILP